MDSTEIYAEGLRIAPLKFYDGGEPNQTLLTIIEKNVRVPVKVFGGLRAQGEERQWLSFPQTTGRVVG